MTRQVVVVVFADAKIAPGRGSVLIVAGSRAEERKLGRHKVIQGVSSGAIGSFGDGDPLKLGPSTQRRIN